MIRPYSHSFDGMQTSFTCTKLACTYDPSPHLLIIYTTSPSTAIGLECELSHAEDDLSVIHELSSFSTQELMFEVLLQGVKSTLGWIIVYVPS